MNIFSLLKLNAVWILKGFLIIHPSHQLGCLAICFYWISDGYMQAPHQGTCTYTTGVPQSGKKNLARCREQGEGNYQIAVALHDMEMLL